MPRMIPLLRLLIVQREPWVGKFNFDFMKPPGVIIQMQLPGLSLMAHALGKDQFSFDFISIYLTL